MTRQAVRRETVPTGSYDELLEIAADMFARFGYVGASIRDIAGAARCTVGNVYHHFRNKEALLLAVLERSVAALPDELRAALDRESEETARFERLVRAHLAAADRFRRESRIFSTELEERLPDAARALNRRLQREVLDIYIDAVGRLADAGLADTDAIRVTALNALGVINWRLRWARPGRSAAERGAEENAITRFVLRGVIGGATA